MAIEKNTPNLLKKENTSFTLIKNSILQHVTDAFALGIYCYLASQFDGWQICEAQLMSHFGCGRDKIRKSLKSLKELGLYEKYPVKNEKNQIVRWETLLRNDIHITENSPPREKATLLKIQSLAFPVTGKTTPINKVINKNKDLLKNKEKPLVHPADERKRENPEFNIFWKAYPKKQKKKESLKRWVSQKLGKHLNEILQDIEYRAKNEWKDKDKQFIPLPSSYLNGRRWEDEHDIEKPVITPKQRQEYIQYCINSDKKGESCMTIEAWAALNKPNKGVHGE